jgi:zinc protease
MRLRKCLLILLLVLCTPVWTRASTFTAPIKEQTLSNGLKVIVIEDHKAPLVTFQIWYRVGSADEPSGKTGMSHLLEHMMFKGTKKYGSKEFSAIIQRSGGTDNAHTTKDYTMYHQTLASDRLALSVELESDRMTNLILDPKDVLSERSVVMEERRTRYEDDPQNSLYEDTVATALKAHPYRRPVIGWMSDIASLTAEDLRGHYRSYYAPDNAFIVVAGDVNADTVLSLIRSAFESIPPTAKNRRIRTAEPEQLGEKRVHLRKEAELPFVVLAYPVPSFPHEDSFALDVLSTILSDGKSSRLHRSLVYEKRLALNAFAEYSALQQNPFVFILGGTAAPGKSSDDVEKALYEEIEKIKREPPAEHELAKVKNQMEAAFVFAQDSTYSRALYTGMFEMLGGYRLLDTYIEGIRKVTPEQVRAAAEKYLAEDKRTAGILVPLRNER